MSNLMDAVRAFDNQKKVSSIPNIINQFNEKLKSLLIEKLEELNFTFKNDRDFLDFCEKRITRINVENDTYYFYLDYENKDITGKTLIICKQHVKLDFSVSKYTATMFTYFEIAKQHKEAKIPRHIINPVDKK